MAKLQELLTRGGAPEQILTDIYRTVTEAVKTPLIGTDLLAMRLGPGDIPGTTLNLVHQTKNSMIVEKVAEGAEVPIHTEGTFSYNVSPIKWAVRPLITKEMIEDSLFAVVERNLREAGYQMGRNLDRNVILSSLRAGTGNTVTGGASINLANIASAINNLETNDYVATDYVIGPSVAQDIRNIDTFVEANKAGVVNPTDSLIGTIFAMNVRRTNNLANATDSIVLDRGQSLIYAEKRPLTVDRYSDVTRQLEGVVLSMRIDFKTIPDTSQAGPSYTTNAISLITTT